MIKNIALAMVSVAALSGLAVAGDPAKGAPAPKDTKTAPPADKATPPAAMEMPKAPQELADMAKGMTGSWKCTGKALGMDMKTMTDMTGTAKPKLEFDGFWMHNVYDAKMGKMPFHFDSFVTYDATAKTWRRVMVESGGGYAVGTSTGPKDNKMDWDLATQEHMGAGMFRDHEDWSDLKVGFKAWGEMSMDKGKTWTKVYEQTCKK